MSDDRPGVYVESIDGRDVTVYRISKSGECIRALVALGRSYYQDRSDKHTALLGRTAEEGNLHEREVVERLVAAGVQVTDQQAVVEVWVVPGRVMLRGHMEGFLTKPIGAQLPHMDYALDPGYSGFEVKSMGKDQFSKWIKDRWAAFPRYAYQVTLYMKANPGIPWDYFVKRRDDGLIHHHIIPADKPPLDFSEIARRIKKAEVARRNTKTHELPACDRDNWFCDYKYLHDEADTMVDFHNLSEDDLGILADLIPKYFEYKDVEDAAKGAGDSRKKEVNPKLLGILGEVDQVRGIPVGDKNYKITRVVQYRDVPDMDAIKVALGDKFDEFTKKIRIEYPVIREDDMK